MNIKRKPHPRTARLTSRELLILSTLAALSSQPLLAQQAPAQPQKPEPAVEKTAVAEDAIELSPFEVQGEKDNGYAATSSLAGSRLNTSLKDVAGSVSVVTSEFMKDTGSTNLQNILVYTTNTEVAGIGGNFYGGNADDSNFRTRMLVNPQSGTRVRGLDAADLTRGYFATDIPMDGYNTSRVDIQRGPNSILFGLGSPAGIINNTLKDPNMKKLKLEGQFRFGSYGSIREVLDADVALIKDTLGLRVIGLNDKAKYRQDFTFNHDKRAYAALRWKPALGRGVFTQIDVKAESGKIDANRPVSVTASDFISNWFNPLNKYLSYNPLSDNGTPIDPNGGRHPELSHYYAGAPARDWWNDSPSTIFQNPGSSAIGNGNLDAYRQRDGEPWGGLSGVSNPNYDEGGSGSWNKNTAAYYANNSIVTGIINNFQSTTGKTFAGFGGSLWPTQSILSGPLAFIDRTMQGPNKKEWNNFDSLNIDLTQTFLDGRLGFNATYDKQSYRSGYANAISTNRVTVDVNTKLRDGSANPDVGRPLILGPSSGNMTTTVREGYRGTGFYKFNIRDFVQKGTLLTKILGEQTFTGVLSGQRQSYFSRNFNLYAWDAASYGAQFNDSRSYKSWWGSHYIGSSLMNVSSFDAIPDSAIQGVTAIQTPAATSSTLVFDSANTDPAIKNTWHKANVSTVGWESNLDKLYTGASQGYNDNVSKSFVWQGRLFNDALIPLFGWREDHYTAWAKPGTAPQNDRNTDETKNTKETLPFSSSWTYVGTKPLDVTEQRRSWGLVLHTSKILDLFHYQLPKGTEISLTYNDSNSFRPSESGFDIMGNKFPSPSGTTKEKGILISTLDNRLSLRVTWYKTSQKNASLADPSGMIFWAKAGIARTINAMAQEAWGIKNSNQTTPEWLVNKWMFGSTTTAAAIPANWKTAWTSTQLAAALAGPLPLRRAATPGDPSFVAQGTINPVSGTPYLSPYLAQDEIDFRAQWFAARTDAQWFGPLDPEWMAAEGFKKVTGDDYRIWGEGGSIPNQVLSNDVISKGVEFELTANPTPNWRLTVNASKNEAVRSNILSDWGAFIEKNKAIWFDGYNDSPESQLNYWTINGIADIRHWTGDVYGSDLAGNKMMNSVYGPYQNLLAATGKSVNELRKWRWNVVTNYTFSQGRLKNLNIGGAARWQDKAAIGYYPKYESAAAIWVTDVSKPIYAPSEVNYDLWIGYERKLSHGVTWGIQLNVRDLFAKSSLIPIAANPDGTVAQARIPSETTWQLTNTFKF